MKKKKGSHCACRPNSMNVDQYLHRSTFRLPFVNKTRLEEVLCNSTESESQWKRILPVFLLNSKNSLLIRINRGRSNVKQMKQNTETKSNKTSRNEVSSWSESPMATSRKPPLFVHDLVFASLLLRQELTSKCFKFLPIPITLTKRKTKDKTPHIREPQNH